MSEAEKICTEEEEEELEQVACLDDSSAEYLLRRIMEANRQYDSLKDWYEKQLAKAAALRDNTIAWAERGLRDYFEMIPDSVKKKAKTQISYSFKGGKLVLKAQAPEYVRDDAVLVPWLKENKMDEFIKVKESADWGELKKTLSETPDGLSVMTVDGECVPGITVEQRGPKFMVVPDEK